MNSTDPNCTPPAAIPPTPRSGFVLRRRLGALAFAALTIAGLVLAVSGGARLTSGHAARAARDQEFEAWPFEWAVVDRLEPVAEQGSVLAVLLAGDKEVEHVLSTSDLPEGASPGVWLRLFKGEDGTLAFEIDHEKTQEARAGVEAKLAELRRRESR